MSDAYKSIIKLDTELNQIQDLDLLLERILLEARKVTRADAGSIYVIEKQNVDGQTIEKLAIKYAQNDTMAKDLLPGEKPIYSVFTLDINEKTIAGYCACTKSLVNVPDVYNISPDAPYSYSTAYDMLTGYKTTSNMAMPLKTAEGKLLGVIQIMNAQDESGNVVPFSPEDEDLITHFATNATMALQKAYVTRAMILRMIKMSELRDPKETGTHVNRVAGYAVEIYDRWAYKQGIPEKERDTYKDTLKIASMLHDVGKVAISDVILKKPAKFTPEEYEIMQHHTIYAEQLFEDPQSPVDLVAKDVALCHHENWDGTGYPRGLKGEDIPLGGRIVALADVYDALCSKRVYKEPWTEEDVLNEMKKLGGTKFDPDLVEAFFDIFSNIKQVASLYPEQAAH